MLKILGALREILVGRNTKIDPAAVAGKLGLPLFVKPNASGSSFGGASLHWVICCLRWI